MRLARAAAPAVERQYESLRSELEFEGASRLKSLESTRSWLDGRLPLSASTGVPFDETAAADLIQARLEEHFEALLPSLNKCAPDLLDLNVYLRPLRSGLSTAFSVSTVGGLLIVVDDAINDLTYSLIQLMLAAWAPPRGEDGVAEPRQPTPLTDVVRVARAALGSVRWNGSLWLPVRIELDGSTWALGQAVNRLAQMFVIAHEIGHAVSGSPAEPLALEHEDWERELSADSYAVRVLFDFLCRDDEIDPEAAGFLRLATRMALEVMDLAADVFTLNQDSHPPAGDRIRIAFERAGHLSGPGPIERPAEHFLAALADMTTRSPLPLSEVIERSPSLRVDPVAELDINELDGLDLVEAVMAMPLPLLLRSLGSAVPRPSEQPPPDIVHLIERANAELSTTDGLAPITTTEWTEVLVGAIWLKDLVGAQGPAQTAATLRPPPGTRFCDWAGWVEREVPDDARASVLAALRILAKEGDTALGDASVIAPLETAFRQWIANSGAQ